MGLFQTLLPFQIPAVETAGYDMNRPYGTVKEYFSVDKSSEQPDPTAVREQGGEFTVEQCRRHDRLFSQPWLVSGVEP
ncbi:hypothetical protein [Algoriphagus jejuensis]|uniref:hypothetical protein n=1 Tax=Algoriphagus jejuensis TaxID=419934 RepID=UPI0031D54510